MLCKYVVFVDVFWRIYGENHIRIVICNSRLNCVNFSWNLGTLEEEILVYDVQGYGLQTKLF